MSPRFFFLSALLASGISTVGAIEPSSTQAKDDAESVLAGHSVHGEAFNKGPRQAAVLIDGMAPIEFPTSTKSALAQQFLEQGIAQLHGFWYLEAERSFRQAAKEDPNFAMPYWGMACANANNTERARGFIDEAMKRRKKASRRETLYIEALDRYIPKDEKDDEESEQDVKKNREAEREAKKKRTERYLSDLEKILHDFPDDVEAKVLIALQMWMGERSGVKLTSRYATNALLGEVFEANPMHPAHHYRIHLWDSARPANALKSAANCGPSSPGIAHMWHMPGHIYSRLKRYNDAAWQQEASARVDHAHMIRTRLMPDQIHNFAHNNEWLVRNLLYVGRVSDALDLSRNLVSLPRHPQYNTLTKRGSYKYGRQRLLQTLTEYGLWEELIREAGGPYLPPTDDAAQQEEWLGWLAVAHFMTGDTKSGSKTLRSLQRRRLALQNELLDLQDKLAQEDAEEDDTDAASSEGEDAEDDSDVDEEADPEELKKHISQLRQIIARGATASAVKRKDTKAFKENLEVAKLNSLIRAQWHGDIGQLDEGLKLAEKAVREGSGQVRPLAVHVDLLWRKGRKAEAKKQFSKLQKVAAVAELDTPMLAKLAPIAKAADQKDDWRLPDSPAKDLGDRPPLDQLGPFQWQPYQSPTWGAKAAGGELVAGEEFEGRPRIIIFYLGFGCLHCVEQLHSFAPMIEQFQDAGIDVLAISSETVEQLELGIKNFDKEMKIPLLSDAEQHVFRSFRCWDDFENQPLHGTFLIDSRGKVRWQDISYEPFNEPEFLLNESKRLLALP
ncbi:MAG: peroxiredoxin family protein [Rubripirellula sp.]